MYDLPPCVPALSGRHVCRCDRRVSVALSDVLGVAVEAFGTACFVRSLMVCDPELAVGVMSLALCATGSTVYHVALGVTDIGYCCPCYWLSELFTAGVGGCRRYVLMLCTDGVSCSVFC